MSVPLAYFGIVLIWATTPLAIKWSSDGSGFLFGVTARMTIGLVLCLLLLLALRQPLPWHKRAHQTYMAIGFGAYGSMLCVYWGAQYIQSGLISVLFGLTPILTGLLAAVYLAEKTITPPKVGGMLLGFVGLCVIFGDVHSIGRDALYGIFTVLIAVFVHSLTTVWVKREATNLTPYAVTTGSLLYSLPLYLITWAIFDGRWPANISGTATWSIIYLGVFGSVLGFILFYYTLNRVKASTVGLIPLLTPVLALLVGEVFNGETIAFSTISGTTLIIVGMLIYQYVGNKARMSHAEI